MHLSATLLQFPSPCNGKRTKKRVELASQLDLMAQASRTHGFRGMCACGSAHKAEETQAYAENNREFIAESFSMALSVDDTKHSQQQLSVFAVRKFCALASFQERTGVQVRGKAMPQRVPCVQFGSASGVQSGSSWQTASHGCSVTDSLAAQNERSRDSRPTNMSMMNTSVERRMQTQEQEYSWSAKERFRNERNVWPWSHDISKPELRSATMRTEWNTFIFASSMTATEQHCVVRTPWCVPPD